MNFFYNKIEDYLNGELDAEARAGFETALQNDPDLRRSVDRHREMIERLRAKRLREVVKKNLVAPDTRGAMSVSINRRFMAAAAVLALVATAVYFWLQQQPAPDTPNIAGPTPTGKDSGAVVETPQVVERPAPPADSLQKDAPAPKPPAQERLTSDNRVLIACADAVRDMENVDYATMGDDVKDPAIEKQLNSAIRLLREQKPARALALIETVLKKNNPLYQEDAQWLQALAMLMRDPVRGKELLEQIEQNPAHAYRRQALELTEKF